MLVAAREDWMQQLVRHVAKSACPHDCPSACALEVPILPGGRIGRITGARDNSYTLGVVCAKVARYAERIEHPDRLLHPMRRKGAKGSGAFEPIGWDAALDEIAENFTRVAQRSGSEAVWPYHSGGNMGILQRYGLDRLRTLHGGQGRHFTCFCQLSRRLLPALNYSRSRRASIASYRRGSGFDVTR